MADCSRSATCWILLILFVAQVKSVKYGASEVVFPERLHEYRSKRDLSTASEGGHEDDAAFSVRAFKNDMILDTKLNKELLHPSFLVRTFDKDDKEILSQDAPDNCYYQGSLRGVSDSMVVLHTCNGLKGLIDDGKNTYHIEPQDDPETPGAHKIYSVEEDSMDNHKCGVSNDEGATTEHDSKVSAAKALVSKLRRGIIVANADDVYLKYLTTKETRYNELAIVVDNKVYQRYKNDTKLITEKMCILVTALDRIYQRINIRIVLKMVEIWTDGDRGNVEPETTGGGALVKARHYRAKHITPRISNDNLQFMSHKGWSGGVIGMAWVRATCGYNSLGVNAWSFGSIIGPWVVVAHEMGHNFGMGHDSGSCKCLIRQGCIMGGHKERVPGFSNCSMEGLKRINDRCLYNVPTENMNAKCGNGIREGNEECDCGTKEMCEAKDQCCEPGKCRLKASSQCSDLHHSCCKDCHYKKQGTLCRSVKSDCDIPEYCPGNSRDCPENSYIQDGVPCNRSQKLIQANTNYWSVVTRKLNPPIQARFVRFNPQYWTNWICMRVGLLGCSPNEDNPALPTAIKAYNDYCVVSEDPSCNPKEGSKLRFKSGYECKEKYMEFTLDNKGILRHTCSGRKVCPRNGARIVIHSNCTDEDATFIRTAKKSLKHKKSGRCIHPNGGWPGNNRELVLWSGCDATRLEFWFMKHDCVSPLGVRSRAIPNNQMTASSSRPADQPYMGRLHNRKYWCAKSKNKHEYLQIDLGEEKTVAYILTQGRGNWHDWVEAYFLSYSEDGQIWTPYTERGLDSNSNCYRGMCAETPATQCKDLWGSSARNADKTCYDKLNTENQGYGTCDAAKNTSCAAKDVLCGQIQCSDSRKTPGKVNYGKSYMKFKLSDSVTCSGAVMKTSSDNLGQGMVADGTKCADKKMCVKAQCKSFAELGISSCPIVDGKECAGRGVCTNKKVCACDSGYDPSTSCKTALQARNGEFGAWSDWTECTRGCDGGIRRRHRFCNNPFPSHNGRDCVGDREQEEKCQIQACPVARSCRHLQLIAKETNLKLGDGVYTIYPQGKAHPIKTFCDMTRNGGGWTLLVTSFTNTWTKDNVRLRNADKPSLLSDFSILKYADSIKQHINIVGDTFEYRLEAQSSGRWGGVWKAPRGYSFTATDNSQRNVDLVQRFDNWKYKDNGIEERMPWISNARLTTSGSPTRNWWGTITADDPGYHPAPWISGHQMESKPEHIWYWMKEGAWQLPRSCMEVQMRGFGIGPVANGIFGIKPPGLDPVKTYCDVTSNGGGWTLVATSKTHDGWTADNVKHRNPNNPSLDGDFSILGSIDPIKDFDQSQDFFEYKIEADGNNKHGGIWKAPRQYTFLSACDKQTNIKLIKAFNDSVPPSSNLAKCMPRIQLGQNSGVFLTSASTVDDPSGSLIYNNENIGNSATYLQDLKKPGVVRYWMREGTRRSCNEIKLHGARKGHTYKDGYYMSTLLGHAQYLPIYCDMESDPGAFTLVVTSRHNSWTRAQVPARNLNRPSTNADYSILKYADKIKDLGHNATFMYKLTAGKRMHWGGVWEAPHRYSFMSTRNDQNDVTLVHKFNNWGYSWWKGLNKRMPWFDKHGKAKKALLTTSYSSTSHPSGSIIWGDTQYHPAFWTYDGGMGNPGTIWYWVNEDDCSADRKPVNGGLSEWGAWQKCDKLCENGTQHRYRTCTKPKSRCGGADCRALGNTKETKQCYSCKESPIKSYNGLCVQPQSGECSPAEKTKLIFHKADANCSKPYMNFVIDADGVIHHKCSKKIICPDGDYPHTGRGLILKTHCPLGVAKLKRLPSKSLQSTVNGKCVHPNGGWPGEGVNLLFWTGCNSDRLALDFFKLCK